MAGAGATQDSFQTPKAADVPLVDSIGISYPFPPVLPVRERTTTTSSDAPTFRPKIVVETKKVNSDIYNDSGLCFCLNVWKFSVEFMISSIFRLGS